MQARFLQKSAVRVPVGKPAARRLRVVAAAAPVAKDNKVPDRSGRMTYRPNSFGEMVEDAARSISAGLKDGCKAMEVEFPPVPTKIDAYKGESDLYIDSNVQLAVAAARKLAAEGVKAHVVCPDQGEYDRAYSRFKSSIEMSPGTSLGHLREFAAPSPMAALSNMFGRSSPDSKPASEKADIFLVINATATELPFVEEYTRDVAKGRPVVLWNLELDSLRGDLGLFGYPPKDLHYRFLAGFKPVFLLRPREYSKSVSVAPFLVNYSGCLFREYPGPWQVMIKQDSGEYACIAEQASRYNLGEVKEELQAALGLNTEAEGSFEQLLRRGVKSSTWWEDDYNLESTHEWRL